MSDGRGVIEINGLFVDDRWRAAEDQKLFDVYQPYDRALYARVTAGGRSDAMPAVDAAAKAFPAWSQSTPAERARLFLKAAGESR